MTIRITRETNTVVGRCRECDLWDTGPDEFVSDAGKCTHPDGGGTWQGSDPVLPEDCPLRRGEYVRISTLRARGDRKGSAWPSARKS
jgi:hypothetical protein